MARPTRSARKKTETPKHRCRDCSHSYDWHDRAFDGGFILCRCPYDDNSKNGKFCKFLTDYQCEHFNQRPTYTDVEAN